VRKVFWLIEDKLAGRPGPSREPWSLEELREAGFDTVLNLSEYPPDEDGMALVGLESSWIPLPTTVPPDQKAGRICLEQVPKTYSFIRYKITLGHRVLVHCNAGCDRTGFVLAYYLARSNELDVYEAINWVRRVRPMALSAEGWADMTVRVMSKLLGNKKPE
jgi:protein-tyrosine phosphatase